MNNTFELQYKSGPHGDACTSYNIIFKKQEITLLEFIGDVVERNPDEWGKIYIEIFDENLPNIEFATENEKYKTIQIEYKYGSVITSNIDVYLDKLININHKNLANGGWSCMNYWIRLK